MFCVFLCGPTLLTAPAPCTPPSLPVLSVPPTLAPHTPQAEGSARQGAADTAEGQHHARGPSRPQPGARPEAEDFPPPSSTHGGAGPGQRLRTMGVFVPLLLVRWLLRPLPPRRSYSRGRTAASIYIYKKVKCAI